MPVQGSDEALKAGLALWRKPDKNGAACASCHSPDGIELAAYGFDDATLIRRATPHRGSVEARQLVDYIHALRTKYGIRKPMDPMNDRPMQPGGEVLSGETPAQRDLAFGRTLPAILPRLMGGTIDSLEAARAARDELLAVDARSMKIGIPMNRLSEDAFHGKEHATVADWIADAPPGVAMDQLYRLEDSYLAAPSDEGLVKLLSGVESLAPKPRSAADQMDWAKFRATLYMQHTLRVGHVSPVKVDPFGLAWAPRTMAPNPMWELAEVARIGGEMGDASFGLSPEVAARDAAGPSFPDQLKQVRLSWYWCGWLMDQGLQRSGFQKETRRADYFSKLLLEEGPYPIHCAFMLTRKLAVQSFSPSAWIGPGRQHVELNYSFLVLRDNLAKYEPSDPESRELFRKFLCNSFRMNLYLLSEELERTKSAPYQKAPVEQQIRFIGDYLAKAGKPADAALVARAANALASAAWVSSVSR